MSPAPNRGRSLPPRQAKASIPRSSFQGTADPGSLALALMHVDWRSVPKIFGSMDVGNGSVAARQHHNLRVPYQSLVWPSSSTSLAIDCRLFEWGHQGDWWRDLRHESQVLCGLESHPVVLLHRWRMGWQVSVLQFGSHDFVVDQADGFVASKPDCSAHAVNKSRNAGGSSSTKSRSIG